MTFRHVALLVLAGTMLSSPAASAQEDPIRGHIFQVSDFYEGAPAGQGLLPTAVAEAQIALQHTGFEADDPTYLDAIKRQIGGMLHAIDPTFVMGGPGFGYGVRQAAADVILHIEMASADEAASDNVKTHARHILATMGNVVQRADAIVALAQEVEGTTSVATAAALREQLNALCNALLSGQDTDRDGRIGWQAGEGGLRQATQHMTLLKRGEGLLNP